MAKIILKSEGDKVLGFINNENSSVSNKNLDFIMEKLETGKISKMSLDGNDLTVIIDGNEVVIKDIDSFLDINKKYLKFKEHLIEYVDSERKKDVQRIKKNNKRKVNRKKSVTGKISIIASILLAISAVGLGTEVYRSFDHGRASTAIYEAYNKPTTTENPVIIDYSTMNAKVYTKQDFDETLCTYAESQGVDREKVKLMLFNNNEYSEEKLSKYKTLIDYMAYFTSNGYIIEEANFSRNNQTVIIAHNYAKFVIIPEKIEKIDSIVQINPSGTSGYYCYPFIIDGVKNGNIPNSIIVGSANSSTDFENTNNGNQLESVLNFSLNHSINITSVGILGYNNSGETAFLNAGRILKDYPNIKVRIANVDGYYVTDYITKLNSFLNGQITSYAEEIGALLNSSAEIINIIPSKEGSGISSERITAALKECNYLENVFSNIKRLYSKVSSSQDFMLEAYQSNILDYLAGKISFKELETNYRTNKFDNSSYYQSSKTPNYANNNNYYQGDYYGEEPSTPIIQNPSWLVWNEGVDQENITSIEDGDDSWASYFNDNNTLNNEPVNQGDNSTWIIEDDNINSGEPVVPSEQEFFIDESIINGDEALNNDITPEMPGEEIFIEIPLIDPNYNSDYSKHF